jgi:hypothetical protein
MSKIITPIEAIIELVTDLKEGQYGVYKSVLFKTLDGEKIWKSFPPDSPELSILIKGARVRLIPSGKTKSGKGHHVIELLDAPSNPPVQPNYPGVGNLSDDQKRQIAAYIEQMGALYRFAYGQAAQHMRGMTESEETLRCCASSLFIAAQRKFNL